MLAAAHVQARTVVALAVACLVSTGCAEREATPPEPLGEIDLVVPASGDTLTGSTQLVADVEGLPSLSALEFRADGVTIASLAAPPWITTWQPDLRAAARPVRLEVVARPALRPFDLRAERVVYLLEDLAPRIHVELPSPSTTIRRRDGLALRLSAWDREDGVLPDSRVRWWSGRPAVARAGAAFELQNAKLGVLDLAAEATDRRGHCSLLSFQLEVFDWRADSDPLGALENFRLALRARDAAAAMERLDAGFAFQDCGASERTDGEWSRARFEERLRDWLSSPRLESIAVEWHASPPLRLDPGSDVRLAVRLSSVEIDARLGIPGRIQAQRGDSDGPPSAGGAALVELRKIDGRYVLSRWREERGFAGAELSERLRRAGAPPRVPSPAPLEIEH